MEKTITLTGVETKIEYGCGCNAWLRNDGTETVYAARAAGITAGADGVTSIPAGGSAPVYGANGTVYLLGTGSIMLVGNDYSTCPFKTSAQSGGSGADDVARAAITAHTENADIHVTTAEKAAWDGKANLSDIPDKLPADGGNADTVDGKHADAFYPAAAAFVLGGNYDNLINDGFYQILGNTDAPSTNSPNGDNTNNHFYVHVLKHNPKWVTQIAISVRGDRKLFIRSKEGDVWNSWQRISAGNAESVGTYTEAKITALEARIVALETAAGITAETADDTTKDV